MGAKTWMLVFSNGSPKAALAAKPTLDREATIALVNKLFAPERLVCDGRRGFMLHLPAR